jgi:Flp pilus assembly protein TadG
MNGQTRARSARSERGLSLILVAFGLIFLLAMAGLAVDLATLYVARNEEQRAADAAALAGASQFVSNSVTSGLITAQAAGPMAEAQAVTVGNQNLVLGQSPNLSTNNFNSTCPAPSNVSGGCLDFSYSNDPQITVTVVQNVPTYFMKVFGIQSVPVSVTATAEAYTPSGSGPDTAVNCVKPWLLPNCDLNYPDTTASANTPISGVDNPNCPVTTTQGSQTTNVLNSAGGQEYYEYFVVPSASGNANTILHPGVTTSGAIGELLTVKPGTPGDAETPSKFWPVFLPTNGSFVCPACASNDQATSGTNSAALYRENIECCSQQTISCGNNTLVTPINGDKVGATGAGVECLINETNQGTGQDCISIDSNASTVCPYSGVTYSQSTPFTIWAGTDNTYNVAPGTVIQNSNSIVTIPIYDGQALCPGGSSAATCAPQDVDVVGWLQLFVQRVSKSDQETVYAFVMNISGCGDSGSNESGSGSVIPVHTGSPIPVRLIHN